MSEPSLSHSWAQSGDQGVSHFSRELEPIMAIIRALRETIVDLNKRLSKYENPPEKPEQPEGPLAAQAKAGAQVKSSSTGVHDSTGFEMNFGSNPY